MNKTRLEAFSDGVLAIIITIMVLEIKVPHGTDWASLKPLVPVFVSYLLSFINVGIYWGNHHHLLHTVEKVTPGIIWANMNLLFWLSLVPFTTGWMGENHFEPTTIITYAVVLLLSGVAFTILQLTVEKSCVRSTSMAMAFARLKIKGTISCVAYLISIPLAFIYTGIAEALFFLVAFMWLIPDKNIAKAINEN